MNSPRAAAYAWLCPRSNPCWRSFPISLTPGSRANSRRTISALPSAEALSTTMISEEIPLRPARAERRQSRRRSRVFQETTRIESSIVGIADPILTAKLRPASPQRPSPGIPPIVTRVRGRTPGLGGRRPPRRVPPGGLALQLPASSHVERDFPSGTGGRSPLASRLPFLRRDAEGAASDEEIGGVDETTNVRDLGGR